MGLIKQANLICMYVWIAIWSFGMSVHCMRMNIENDFFDKMYLLFGSE